MHVRVNPAGGPRLCIKHVCKLMVDPTGEVKREFFFYEDGCR